MFHGDYAYSTAHTYISAIRFQHRIMGMSVDPNNITISKMLEGYCRSKFSQDTSQPITYDILVKISA